MRLSNLPTTALTALALPVVVVQGRRLGRTTPHLPEATGTSGTAGSGAVRCRIVVVGDSVAAGQGVDRGERTIAGRLATLLAGDGAAARWVVHARGGLDGHPSAATHAAMAEARLLNDEGKKETDVVR